MKESGIKQIKDKLFTKNYLTVSPSASQRPASKRWQIVPDIFLELLRNSDEQKKDRAMKAMMKMKKLDIKQLQQAVNG